MMKKQRVKKGSWIDLINDWEKEYGETSSPTLMYVEGGMLLLDIIGDAMGNDAASEQRMLKMVSKEQVESSGPVIKRVLATMDSEEGMINAFKKLAKERQDVNLVMADDAHGATLTTRLSVNIIHVGLRGGKGENPDLCPAMSVEYWIAGEQYSQIISRGFKSYAHSQSSRKFADWAQDDGKVLEEQIDLMYSHIAKSVLETAITPR
ncbi:hypothetical protein ACFL6Y_10075 [Elusimicrobiota bacterium]